MPDMFGAPIGIGAAETDMRQSVLGGLQAQQALAQIDLTKQHAGLYRAQAEEHAAKVAQEQQLAQLGQEAAARGEILTAQKVISANEAASLADPLESMWNLGVKKGISPLVMAPLATKIAGIKQKEAAVGSAQAAQALKDFELKVKKAERLGGMAQAAMESPEAYAQLRLLGAQEGLPVDRLPQDFNAAQPILQALVTSSMKAKDSLELQRKVARDAVLEKLDKSTEAKNFASAKVAGARYDLTTERYNQLKKSGGAGSPGLEEDRKSRIRERERKALAEDRKLYPEIPASPDQRMPGKSYTLPDGRKVLWTTNPETGKPGMQLLNVPKFKASTPAEIESSDEDDGEDGEE